MPGDQTADCRRTDHGYQKAGFRPDSRRHGVEIYTLNNARPQGPHHDLRGDAGLARGPRPDGGWPTSCSHDALDGYLKSRTNPYFGSMSAATATGSPREEFTLDGVTYELATNNGENLSTAGIKGFDKVVWKAEPVKGRTAVGLSHLPEPGRRRRLPREPRRRGHLHAERPTSSRSLT